MATVLARESLADQLTELRQLASELYDLGRVAELLGWDQEVMMPTRGVPWRASQLSTLTGVIHERLTSAPLGELIRHLSDASQASAPGLSDADHALVREMRRSHEREVKLPARVVKEIAEATTEALATWQKARAESNFAMFQPYLERIVRLKREVADHVGYQQDPYDALLDEYEPHMTVAQLEPMFDGLRAETVALLDRIRGSRAPVERSILERGYDLERQWQLGETVLRWIGFDFEGGRLDRSTHPFCTHFGVGDVRMTTRLDVHDLGQGLFGTMHEGGHGLYEQGIAEPLHGSPIGTGISLGVHESQSRMFENLVGRSRPFWEFALPRLAEVFPDQLGGVDVDQMWRAVNVVRPSLIRVEADEVTYNLHIILRFNIERKILRGDLSVADLPAAWNEQMRDLLGLTPEDDRHGVLQDIHWAMGLYGYFPTYTLGNLYSAQLWAAMGRDLPDREERMARGDLSPILGWVRDRIHRHGATYLPADLVERATGAPPDARYLGEYLRSKYAAVYELSG